jgi:hypothetical protein
VIGNGSETSGNKPGKLVTGELDVAGNWDKLAANDEIWELRLL